jgi:hypothetical protein
LKNSSVVVLALSYSGAVADRLTGTWSPIPVSDYDATAKSDTSVVDKCNIGPIVDDCGGYNCWKTIIPALWSTYAATDQPPHPAAVLDGTRSLWCGTQVQLIDAGGNPVGTKLGYPNSPNLQPHMLYVLAGNPAAPYTLTFRMKFSSAPGDTIYLIGGGSSAGSPLDPIGSDWDKLGQIIRDGTDGTANGARVLVRWTGSFTLSYAPATVNLLGQTNPVNRVGATNRSLANPSTHLMTIQNVPSIHRALYFVFRDNGDGISSERGWPYGEGQILDQIAVNGAFVYQDQGPPLSCTDLFGGTALACRSDTTVVAARTPFDSNCTTEYALVAGPGDLGDNCAIRKAYADERIWSVQGEFPTENLVAGVLPCTYPVPPNTGALLATWNHYLDIPNSSGYVQVAEYRFFKNGSWSAWRNTNPGGYVRAGAERSWTIEVDELPEAVQADSVQLRYEMRCVPALSTNGITCPAAATGVLYDDFGLFAFTGLAAASVFGVFPGHMPQTTFVDGTMPGRYCTAPPCWPGVRGSELGPGVGIDDNVNSPAGDSVVVFIYSPLRTGGMGLNWQHGFDKTVADGLTIAHSNGSFNAAFDVPRAIYRLFDPATRSWSPWDSTRLDADDVSIGAADTFLVQSAFRMDWPPRDKIGLSLPGGFTINGASAYANLSYLPRGTRLQYYLKAVDVLGNTVCQFQGDGAAYETADLPTLPGGSVKAPDIMQFEVLPGRYPAGSAGSLLAGRTDTPVLNLDGSYTTWGFSTDPVTQALRGLGVRADRYRLQQAVGYGHNIGGHELTDPPDNQMPDRPSNFFPNMTDYAIRESLSTWYRILIQSGHVRLATLEDESDAYLIEQWWLSSTSGANGGDRCFFVSGDHYARTLLNDPAPSPRRLSLAQNVMGVQSAEDAWNGTQAVPRPALDDRFANPASGPGLASGYSYPLDGACPAYNRFDALTKSVSADAQNAAFYPLHSGVTNVAAVAMTSEKDGVTDHDRNKAIAYGSSIQFVRKPGISPLASNYAHSGIEERMRILYKFLVSCRGARSGAASDTAKCWPCPSDPNMTSNWATSGAFNTAAYGPLYPIQDPATVTGVGLPSPGAPAGNRLDQNRPNPFNPTTAIPYANGVPGRVMIRIYDVGGRLVRTLDEGNRPPGEHLARWDGRLQNRETAGSGVYFYRIEYPGGGISSKKMILLR